MKNEMPVPSTVKTPLEIATGIRAILARPGYLATVTVNSRREMDLVVDQLTYEENRRTRFTIR